ncbi:MAG: dimethylsulfoniopropionate demethylase [Pseudomonadota bacterium]
MKTVPISLARRVRETPFEKRMLANNPGGLSVYNHMTIPTVFESMEADYAHLCEHVQIWDVACERQVEVNGPDALKLVELCTPRDLSDMSIGQGRYAPLVDEFGGIVNDPIILKLAQDRYWVSIADSDVLLWMKGLAAGLKLDVSLFEPDVSPLAVQGPKADDLMAEIVGEQVRAIRFFWFIETTISGAPVVIARSGWSGQGGFELYLQDSRFGSTLWDTVFDAGRKFNIRAGCPNLIERLESGLLSYGNDMTLNENPFECGLDAFFKLGKDAEYLCRDALERIARDGPAKRLVKLKIHSEGPIAMRSTLDVVCGDETVGTVTSQAYSQKHGSVLSLAYIDSTVLATDPTVDVIGEHGTRLSATICSPSWG